jgi:hypothetical protein
MPDFGKNALTFKYMWSVTEQSSRYVVFCQDDIIDRTNGYHVLDFINRFMMLYGLVSTESFTRAEKLIYGHMPTSIKTRAEMKFWLSKSWNRRL